ncbi:MAG: sulfurtransferase-like selenium metabolism protein YedF [Syntrophomonadaceae bacterium]
MTRTVDARGLSCPQPVILTKRVMDEKSGEDIVTMVDNATARENVSKLAISQGYGYKVENQGAEYHIHMTPPAVERSRGLQSKSLAVLVKSQYFGEGDDELGAILTRSFFYTLTELGDQLHAVIFMNGGVHLTTEGSPILENLQYLEEKGVDILSCGTCLEFFGKKDQLRVGGVTNMYTALEIMADAHKSLVI